MKLVIIDGLRVIEEPNVIEKEGKKSIILRCAINTSEKVQGEWTEKPNYFSVFCAGEMFTTAQKMKIKKGSTLSLIGGYRTGVFQSEKGDYVNMTVYPDRLAYSTGSIGSTGAFLVFLTNAGIINEPVSTDSYGYCDVLCSEGFGDKKETFKYRCFFQGKPNALIGKGKRVDVMGRLSISLNKAKDGRVFVNETINVKEYNKAPFTVKKDSQQPQPQNQVTQQISLPTEPADFGDFTEITDEFGGEFF